MFFFSIVNMYAGVCFTYGNVLKVAHDISSEQKKIRSSWRELTSVKFILVSMPAQ